MVSGEKSAEFGARQGHTRQGIPRWDKERATIKRRSHGAVLNLAENRAPSSLGCHSQPVELPGEFFRSGIVKVKLGADHDVSLDWRPMAQVG